jgi:hypothetical protein
MLAPGVHASDWQARTRSLACVAPLHLLDPGGRKTLQVPSIQQAWKRMVLPLQAFHATGMSHYPKRYQKDEKIARAWRAI